MIAKLWKAGLFGAIALASLAPVAQAAEGEWGPFTAGASLTSDYRFRGISQSSRDAAVQGWIQYDHSSGFYANIWASTIDFDDAATYDSGVEIDLTAGYIHQFSENTSLGVKAIYYWYADADTPPLAPDYDYWEFLANVTHDFGAAEIDVEVAWSPEFFAESGDAIALTGGVTVPILDSFAFFDGGLKASAAVGHQWLDTGPDYLYWDIGATATWGLFDFDVRWHDTDLNTAQCGFTDNCEGGIVLSVTANLPG